MAYLLQNIKMQQLANFNKEKYHFEIFIEYIVASNYPIKKFKHPGLARTHQ